MFREWLPFSLQLGWPQVVLVAIVFFFLLVAMFIAVRAGYRLSLGVIGFKFEPLPRSETQPPVLEGVVLPHKAARKKLATSKITAS